MLLVLHTVKLGLEYFINPSNYKIDLTKISMLSYTSNNKYKELRNLR